MSGKIEKPAPGDAERRNRDLAVLAARAMYERRAEDIVVLDLRTLVDYADFFVVASAASVAQVRGATRAAEKALSRSGGKRLTQPGRESGWVLVDFGDILVHVFDRAAREFYRLEDLWGDAPRIDWMEGYIPTATPDRFATEDRNA
ncbi:MAG: ribosome silencing factor [Planctomycetota bacterium]|jgi:ribosome-associated protein|nr:ribosome silencing factor [Planctomycetota bacterium]